VAGEGSQMASMKAELQASGLHETVHVLGGVPSGKMPELMAASDIFFLPSQNEGISLALYEAMSSGLAIVGANVGGQGELVTPGCGVLVTHGTHPDEAAAYADILHDLVNDPPRRQAMAHASRMRMVEQFDLSCMGETVHKHLLRVIEGKQAGIVGATGAPEELAVQREIRTLVEYLQVRQRQQWLEREYSALITPKPPSHWFYLWVRQLFLPLYQRISATRSLGWVAGLILGIKRRLVKAP
jgi:hypothetical protein